MPVSNNFMQFHRLTDHLRLALPRLDTGSTDWRFPGLVNVPDVLESRYLTTLLSSAKISV